MIVRELYPTTSQGQGYSLTSSIETLSYGSNIDDPLRPYSMGYINYNDYPKFYDLANVTATFDGNTNKVVVKSAIAPANHAWGYAAYKSPDTSYYEQTYRIQYDADSNVWRAKQGNVNQGNIMLINQGYLAVYSVQNYIQLKIAVSVTNDDNTKPNGTIVNGSITTINDYFMFCNGDIPLSFVFGGNTYDLYISDFDDNGYVVLRNVADTATYVVAIVGFECTERGTGNSTSNPYVAISPWIKIDTDDKPLYQSYNKMTILDCRIYTHNGNAAMEIVNSGFADIYGYKWLWGLEGEITYQQTQTWAKSYDTEAYHYIAELNCFRNYTGYSSATGYQWQLRPIIKPLHIRTYLSLRLKTNLASTASMALVPANLQYTTGIIVNKYDSSDVPTGDILNGAYQDIMDDLRPWQLWQVDVQVNTFDPSDIPPYGPSPGDDKENTGSDIIRPATLGVGGTNGFITQYALTASQIAEIGRLLWLSFANIDYYKNFLFTLTTTGTIDLANLLDYFVSLRVYPFPLINVPSWASAGQDMYIGAGFIPLHFSSTIHTINNYADYIDAGTCEIPRSYGDFRDLTHCEIMLYLPYCGTVQLNPADVVGGTLHAQYAIDFATGGCIAYVDLYTWDGRQFMIAALSGSIGADIPLTATNATQIAARIASNALNVAGTLGNGAAGVAAEVPTIAVGAASGNVPMAAMGAVGALGAEAGTAVGLSQDAMRIATQDAVKMPMMAGGRGFAGFGSPQTAYVQIRRGLYAEGHTAPQGFTQAYGNMYAKPVTVDSCTGFTVFANVDTSGLIAQADERDAIRSLMQSGIYI